MSAERRLAVASAARRAFEDGKIRIPANNGLRQDILNIKMAPGATGAPRLVTSRDDRGHADRAWALFLAIAAAQIDPPVIEFEVVAHRRDWGSPPWRRFPPWRRGPLPWPRPSAQRNSRSAWIAPFRPPPSPKR